MPSSDSKACDLHRDELLNALHAIWLASGGTRQMAEDLLENLAAEDWVRFGAIDLAAETRFRFQGIVLKENGAATAWSSARQTFGEVTVLHADAGVGAFYESAIVYGDSGRVACLRPPLAALGVVTRDSRLLLLGMAYMRYHADNITVLPGKLQREEFEHLSHQFELPVHHLRVLAECLSAAVI